MPIALIPVYASLPNEDAPAGEPLKRGRGRPPGATNKLKVTTPSQPESIAKAQSELIAEEPEPIQSELIAETPEPKRVRGRPLGTK